MPSVNNKLLSLQVGRAVAALYVVVFHTSMVLEDQFGVLITSKFIDAGHSGVEFFFVLSGFIMFHIHWKDVGVSKNLGRYLYRRFARIYPVFWLILLSLACGQYFFAELEPSLTTVVGLTKSIVSVIRTTHLSTV